MLFDSFQSPDIGRKGYVWIRLPGVCLNLFNCLDVDFGEKLKERIVFLTSEKASLHLGRKKTIYLFKFLVVSLGCFTNLDFFINVSML